MRPDDFRTPTWKRLSRHIEQRIDELRKLNDSLSNGPDKTAAIRGGIAELSKILALPADDSASPAVDPEQLGVGDPGQ